MSNKQLTSSIGIPFPLGMSILPNGDINFAVICSEKKQHGIVLYDKKTEEESRIVFGPSHLIGNIYGMKISSEIAKKYTYNFFIGAEVIPDIYTKKISGNEIWGNDNEASIRCHFDCDTSFNWEEDMPLMIPYEKSIMYQLHVRGFTKHNSSKVKNKGTFEGIIEKIPYFKELGITTLELMPCYDFLELDKPKSKKLSMEQMVQSYKENLSESKPPKMNYWGYKEALYFVPKNSFSAVKNGSLSFKHMVKELHKNGIEVILQFYFPNTIQQSFMVDVLRYWKEVYHVDGFRILGENIPFSVIATDTSLMNTKLMYQNSENNPIYGVDRYPSYKNIALYSDEFMHSLRKFLKSDESSLQPALYFLRNNGRAIGHIHYLSNFNSFTLQDLVSYNKKQNEENGENELDGTNNNFSWNCGVEGKTKKKIITTLRKKQYKNALTLLLLSQGTPLLVAGDEFGNSQNGNNNPYCQDNNITWINWRDLETHKECFNYTKNLISLRKSYPVFLQEEFKMTDYLSCGYPDLSYHGEAGWTLTNKESECFAGIMYWGDYFKYENGEKSPSIYIAYNMHWEKHDFALPKLPKGMKWKVLLDTTTQNLDETKKEDKKNPLGKKSIEVNERSIMILTTE